MEVYGGVTAAQWLDLRATSTRSSPSPVSMCVGELESGWLDDAMHADARQFQDPSSAIHPGPGSAVPLSTSTP